MNIRMAHYFQHYSGISILRSHPLVIILLLLTSASAHTNSPSSETIKNDELPKWVTTPPQDTSLFIYGIGAGINLKESKQAALADIAGKINTKVSNQTQVLLKLKNDDLQSQNSPPAPNFRWSS